MGSGMGFTQFLGVAAKLFITVILLVLVGVPMLTGVGIGILMVLLHIVSGILLSLLSNPLGLFVAGVVALLLLRRRRINKE